MPPRPTYRTSFRLPTEGMVCEKGIQILLTTVGAFAAFGLMTVAIGTDYWLYSRALICNSTANVTQDDPHNKDKKDPGALTHSGLWRICCLEGIRSCRRISGCLAAFVSLCVTWTAGVFKPEKELLFSLFCNRLVSLLKQSATTRNTKFDQTQ